MPNIINFNVSPVLPEELAKLKELAYNLYWSWVDEIIQLFIRMDPALWEETGHNPVAMLGRLSQKQLEELAKNTSFVSHLERAYKRLQDYINGETLFQKKYGKVEYGTIAYFSAEFGVTEALPIYSGGLGILAGDHLKSASDLGLPLVGVGLLYQQGYFRQHLNLDGWQQEFYPDNDFYNLPIQLLKNSDHSPVTISVDFPGRKVSAQVWLAKAGRVLLYLLNTNIPQNNHADQHITDQLYGGDIETRIQQEIILGIGGIRALRAAGISPAVCHMNEGHAGFLALERIRELVTTKGLSYWEAHVAVRPGNVFTTHTPVEAGIDQFPPALMEKYFGNYSHELGIPLKDLLGLGRLNREDNNEMFNMAYLAFSLSSFHNGVSKLHGEVARKMWQKRWAALPFEEIPIDYVTNGVHYRTWISRDMKGLYNRYLGPAFREDPANPEIWQNIDQVPAEELWHTHERRRERLVAFARRRLKEQLRKRGASPHEIDQAEEILNPDALTIGFARRFATYKRGNLILRHKDRLKKLLTSKERPVQFVFAGKAHPKDGEGKDIIRQIIHFSRDPEIRNHMVFIEDYDLTVARYMVQGVDVWLNNPRRPLEASGTSGMKASCNGVLNLSCLDGWWDEAYADDPNIGWAIGKGEDYQDLSYQDEVEAHALYDLLEKEVIPLYYDRGQDGLPRGWIKKMKNSLKKLGPVFNTNRMVKEYTEKSYIPAYERFKKMGAENFERARKFAFWQGNLWKKWPGVNVLEVEADTSKELPVGSELKVQAVIRLGNLRPEDVTVEVFYGTLNTEREIARGSVVVMQPAGRNDGAFQYTGKIKCSDSGLQGFSIRIFPKHEDLVYPYETRLIYWY